MTAWAFAFGWNWLLVPVAIWFARGVYNALTRPRIQFLTYTHVSGHGWLCTVRRQELLPPWRLLTESYLVPSNGRPVSRESDGHSCSSYGSDDELGSRIKLALNAALARASETEELSK
jgi:hypothetical protein